MSLLYKIEKDKTLVYNTHFGAPGEKGDKGDKGDTGATGAKGDKGDNGVGVVAGGTTGQVLAKKSNTDYDTEWVTNEASTAWGDITGTLANQTDLNTALDSKANSSTTLSGYGITDAKIENGTVTLGNNTITPLTSHQDITGKEDKTNKVTSLSSSSTDTEYPSAKVVYDELESKADSSSVHNMPTGGTANQILSKVDGTDYNTQWVDAPTSAVWGSITGTLSNQSDLNTALSGKADSATTLGGYGITDAKIENGVVTLGNNTITPLTTHQDISGKENTSNKIAEWDDETSETYEQESLNHYPNEKLVRAELANKSFVNVFNSGTATNKVKYIQVNNEESKLDCDKNWGEIGGTLADQTDLNTALSAKADASSVHSIPSGGTANQVLSKVDGTDYNVEWADASGGSSEEVDYDFSIKTSISANETITLRCSCDKINWGDGTTEESVTSGSTHTYTTAGVYKISLNNITVWPTSSYYNILGNKTIYELKKKNTVNTIGAYGFGRYSGKLDADALWGVEYIGEWAFKESYFTTLDCRQMGSNNIRLGSYAFYNCGSLGEVTLTKRFYYTSSGYGNDYAFGRCHRLAKINIPEDNTQIEKLFYSCNYIERINAYPKTPPSINSMTFPSNMTAIIYVPWSSDHSVLNAYKSATNWSVYADYMVEDGAVSSGSSSTEWGDITGTLSDQTDLNTALSGKADTATTLAGYGITDANITSGVITLGNDTITPLTSHQDISGKEDTTNKVTTISSSSTDTEYPSAKSVYTYIQSLDGNSRSY